ncbi:hypothetical protein ABZ791_28560 [Streptomyces huasconensis]|uniref:Uncharacterized protein n=1 Tax=Streptomyces huasconensis TaxID=1854574 RepID=A0ABV3LY96_9ACTN
MASPLLRGNGGRGCFQKVDAERSTSDGGATWQHHFYSPEKDMAARH